MSKNNENNIHGGHRDRMRNRFMRVGLDGFDEHEILEFVLFHALPRKDTNAISHSLISRFGSLNAVLDAPESELLRVDGMGKNCVTLIKFLKQFREMDLTSIKDRAPLDTSDRAGKYIMPLFTDFSTESVFVIALDEKLRPICHLKAAEGGLDSAVVSPTRIVRYLVACGASNAILAHNHPHGVAVPSVSDVKATDILKNALDSVAIKLVDHMIFVEGDYTSFRDSGANIYTVIE